MIHKLVNCFFLFLCFRIYFEFTEDPYSSIRTGDFAGRTACTTMFVIFIVCQNYFSTETIPDEHFFSVLGILLCNDLFVMRKVITGHLHALTQRVKRTQNRSYVHCQVPHAINASPLLLPMLPKSYSPNSQASGISI